MASYIAAIIAAFLSLFGTHHSVAYTPPPDHAPANGSQVAAVANPFSARPTPAPAESATTSATPVESATSATAILSDAAPAFDTKNLITQSELTAQLEQLSNSLTAKFTAPATVPVPQYVAADGNPDVPYAAVSNITNLSGVTISNSTIDASSIPDLSGNYLSLNGGTLSGAFFDSSTASSSFTGALGIGTTSPFTMLSVTGNGYFSGSLNVADAVTTRSNLGLSYASSADLTNNTNLATWGDSLTADSGGGSPYPTVLATLSGYTVYNGGVGGQTSTQIASRMLAATSMYSYPTIIWAGRNNYSSPSTVEADIASMVAALQSVGNNNYLILSILNGDYGSNEYIGGTGYNQIISINDYLSTTYGSHYLNVRSYLVSLYNPTLPLDVIDHTNDVPPTSLHYILKSGTLGNDIGTSDTSFTLNYTSGSLAVGDIISIDGERILVGSGSSGSTVTNATRGYLGTTAASHTSGTAFNVYDQIHLSGTGYADVANYIYQNFSVLQSTTKVLTTQNLGNLLGANVTSMLASPPVIGSATPNIAYVTSLGVGTTTVGAWQIEGQDNTNGTAGWRYSNINTGSSARARFILNNGVNYATLNLNGSGYTTDPNLLSLSNMSSAGVSFGAGGSEIMRMTTVGLGIGTTTPQRSLDIWQNSNANFIGESIENPNTSGSVITRLALTAGTATTYLQQYGSGNTTAPSVFTLSTPGALYLSPAGAVAMTVLVGGNIGIGTSTTYAKLDLFSSTASSKLLGFQRLTAAADAGWFSVDSGNNVVFTTQNSALNLATNWNSGSPLSTAYFTYNGLVGIGTTTPSARLSVWGPDAASSTLAFNVVSSASTTLFSVFDGGNAELSGTLSQSSDQRLKTNIQSLDSSSSLSAIDTLNPVTFSWIDPEKGSDLQLGFIAQQVQQVFPNLVSTTSPTALTPDGTLSLNYIGLISPIASAIQELDKEIANLAATVASFTQSFVSNNITATNELCVGSTCVTPAQFQAMAAAANVSQLSGEGTSNTGQSDNSTATDTPPDIQVNGSNPAMIEVGDTYNDLGAIVTGPQADLNLGIKTFLNGALVSNIVLDTSAVATDTIDYVAADQSGVTSTSTRTVIVEAPATVPTDATTTDP